MSFSFEFGPSPRLQELIDFTKTSLETQWLGADCACSWPVSFSDGTSFELWFFADTAYGHVNTTTGHREVNGLGMVHSSVGILGPNVNLTHLEFTWRTDTTTGKPASYFTPINSSVYYWPQQVIGFPSRPPHRGEEGKDDEDAYDLFVTLSRQPAGGGLECDGMSVAKIHVARETVTSPLQWEVSIHPAPSKIASLGNGFTWGTAAIIYDPKHTEEGDYVYLMGRNQHSPDVYMSRIPTLSFLDLQWADLEFWVKLHPWEFWSEKGKWIGGVPADLKLLPLEGLSSNPEVNLFWSDVTDSFLMIKIPGFGEWDFHVYESSSVLGPFKDLGVWYSVPQYWQEKPKIIVYAFKMHPFLANATNQLVYTYNVNCMGCSLAELGQCFANYDEFYVPQMVTVEIEKTD